MKRFPLTTLLMTLLLTACSELPDQPLNTDLNQTSCCSTLSALPVTALSVPFHQQVVMDADLPTLSSTVLYPSETAPSQPLPVMSYHITSDAPFSLLVRSYVNNSALFAANVLIYDQSWQLISDYSAKDFTYHTTGMRGLERVEQVITINPQLKGAKYVIITADPAILDKELPRKSQEKVYAESQHVIGNKQLPLTATFQPVGVVDITTSTSHSNEVLTLLTELGAKNREDAQPTLTHAAAAQAKDQWALYREKIDSALENQDVKQAAHIANLAAQQGFTQAKDYLVEQLAK
ncbi:MalM family protein [Vibrio palustris]|uniref:Maltose regulon periplasmic protein n=1 Tax=Vibrio palustris TaxID=1918946 RepID=A0A1R4B4Q3_9VIBR|nr:MalM family protein [Vibrio palustris]SJL83897.1 maltose regulon periplasmic protein [Vibrio palustris]